MSASASTRTRLRQLGFAIGTMETGPENAITDVPGVLVGHSTLIHDEPDVVRTGITMVVPRADVWTDYVYAGSHVLNGDGEMTGLIWVAESGMLGSPIGITSTSQVGLVRDFLVAETHRLGVVGGFHLPVVGRDVGWLAEHARVVPADERSTRPLRWRRRRPGRWRRDRSVAAPG